MGERYLLDRIVFKTRLSTVRYARLFLHNIWPSAMVIHDIPTIDNDDYFPVTTVGGKIEFEYSMCLPLYYYFECHPGLAAR